MATGEPPPEALSVATHTALSASDLAENTPPSRDRYVDFLRLASIGVVVLGHWLMAVVTWRGSTFHVDNAIELTPGLWLATWALQVMPIFFFVGGFANFVTLDSIERKGQTGAEFVASRVDRLLRPVAVLLAVWLSLTLALVLIGTDAHVLGAATKLVCQPLWFIAVYLAVTALAPGLRRLHIRRPIRTVATLFGCAVAVDLFRFGLHVEAIGYLNLLFVWLLRATARLLLRGPLVDAGSTITSRWSRGERARRSRRPDDVRPVPALHGRSARRPHLEHVAAHPFSRRPHRLPGRGHHAVASTAATPARASAGVDGGHRRERDHHDHLLVAPFRRTRGRGCVAHARRAATGGREPHVVGVPSRVDRVRAHPADRAHRALWSVRAPAHLARSRPGRGSSLPVGAGVALLCVAVLGLASTDLVGLIRNAPIHLEIVTLSPLELAAMAAMGLVLIRRAVPTSISSITTKDPS